jgi:hypothetical protein
MANTIKIKNSGTPSAVPGSLEYGELGLNYADGKIFYKNGAGIISEFTLNAGNINAHESVELATTTVLPNSPTYTAGSADGKSGLGIGAYLESGSNAVLVVDSVTPSVGDRILVKDQVNQIHNGIYSVTTVGTISAKWRLTRALDFDNSTGPEVTAGDYTYSARGTVNTGKAWMMNATGTNTDDSIKIGTDNITFISVGIGPKGDTGATGAGGALGYWGSFWSTQDQTAAATGTAYAITFNNSDTANSGVTLSNSSRINFTNAGVYSLTFSVQFANADNQIKDANVWFKKNGTNVDASDSSFSVVESHGGVDGKAIGTVNLVSSLSAGDYIELFWKTTSTNVRIDFTDAASPTPSAPSVIFTAVQVMYTQLPSATVLDDFQNVTVPTPSSGDFLKYNGSAWVNDAIDLGTDTTGNYMSNVTAGNLITVTHTPGEGSSAAIAVTSGTSGQIIVANATGVATWVTESGDITVDASGVTSISSNVIVNADINASAAISHSKLANATAGQVLLGTTTTGVITATTISGDITIDGAGVVTIAANSVALGTDTTGNYVSSLVAGSGITLSNNSGEGATPTVALTSNSLTVNGTSIALGGSGTVTANASTLTGTSLNSSVVGSSLTSVGTLTSLTVSGNVSVTGGVIDHVITNQQTASYTLVLADDGDLVEMNVGTANNLTVPADNTVNFPIGTSIDILQVGAGQTTIVATSGVTINRSTGLKLRTQWSAATLIKRAANTWVAIGDLSA